MAEFELGAAVGHLQLNLQEWNKALAKATASLGAFGADATAEGKKLAASLGRTTGNAASGVQAGMAKVQGALKTALSKMVSDATTMGSRIGRSLSAAIRTGAGAVGGGISSLTGRFGSTVSGWVASARERLAGIGLFRDMSKEAKDASKEVKESFVVMDGGSSKFFSGFKARIAGAVTGLRSLSQRLEQTSRSLRVAGYTLTAFGAGIGVAIKSFLTEAANTQETANLFREALGDMSGEAMRWSEAIAGRFRVVNYEVQNQAASFFSIFKALEFGNEQALTMSENLTEMAYDLASFRNISNDTAFQKLLSGITGQIRPLRPYGVDISEAAIDRWAELNGLVNEFTGELTQQQKVVARYAIISKALTDAHGDLVRTEESLANQQRRLGAQWVQLKAVIGEALTPAANFLFEHLNALMTVVVELTKTSPNLVKWVGVGVAAFGALAAVVGPLLFVLPGIATAVGALATPAGAVAAAIAVLAVAVAVAVARSEALLENVARVAAEFYNWAQSSGVVDGMLDFLGRGLDTFGRQLQSVGALLEFTAKAANDLFILARAGLSDFWRWVTGKGPSLENARESVAAMKHLTGLWGETWKKWHEAPTGTTSWGTFADRIKQGYQQALDAARRSLSESDLLDMFRNFGRRQTDEDFMRGLGLPSVVAVRQRVEDLRRALSLLEPDDFLARDYIATELQKANKQLFGFGRVEEATKPVRDLTVEVKGLDAAISASKFPGWVETIRRGLGDAIASFDTFATLSTRAIGDVVWGWSGAFYDFFDDVKALFWENLDDAGAWADAIGSLINGLFDSILRAFMNMVAQMAAQQLFTTMFGAAAIAPPAVDKVVEVLGAAGAPRPAASTVPESVITATAPATSAGRAARSGAVTINITNQAGVEVVQEPLQENAEGVVMGLVLKALTSNQGVRQAIRKAAGRYV